MEEQTTIFEYISPTFKINRHVRLIEMFAGIGSQAKALENLGVDFEHWKVIEFDKHAVASYNAIHGTNFETSDIRNVHAADLDMRERERETYILTYSFPCQDLSVAGAQRGMTKGSGTRSGLLWEVERILCECGTELPHVLLMENVPNVIGKNNIKDFQLWRDRLEQLGYSNYVSLLNAKNYGIPQNRERCFMVSILGDWNYTFPKKIPLKLKLKDVLESEVDKKYYVSREKIEALQRQSQRKHKPTFLEPSVHTHTQSTHPSVKRDCGSNTSQIVIAGSLKPWRKIQQRERVIHPSGVAPTLTATEYKDPTKVLIPSKTKKGYEVAVKGDGVYINRPHQKRGTVQKGIIQTLKTSCQDIGVVVNDEEQE